MKSSVERERMTNNITALEKQLMILKKDKEKLQQQTTQQRNKLVDSEQRVKKSQMNEKNLSAQKVKAEKQERQLEKLLDTVKANISDKRWLAAKTTISTFIKKNEGSSNQNINISI